MSKGFGIAALIIALIAFGIPVFGLYISWLAAILAAIAALAGDRVFATTTPIIATVNILFLSPLTVAAIDVGLETGDSTAVYIIIITIVLFAAPFIAMVMNATGKIALGKASG